LHIEALWNIYNINTALKKSIAGRDECSPSADCLEKAELVIKHHVYT